MKITILNILSLCSPLLAIVSGWRQRFTLLWFLAATGLIIDNLGVLLVYLKIDQHWAGNIFILAEFLFLSFYYKKYVYKRHYLFYIITGVTALLFIIYTIDNSIYHLNIVAAGILCAYYIFYSIVGFYIILRNLDHIYLNEQPFFWANLAVFTYASANFILFLSGSYLQKTNFRLLLEIWGTFFTSINIMHYLLIGISLYKTKRN